MESSSGSFHEEALWEAMPPPGQEQIEASIASPRLWIVLELRLDRAGAGRPAPRFLQADLVVAEEAEPDARPEDMQPVLPASQAGEGAATDDNPDVPEVLPFRVMYNKFCTRYRRWVSSQLVGLEGRQLARAKARLQLQGKSAAEKIKLAEAFWAAKGVDLREREEIVAHWLNKESGVQGRLWLHSKSVFLTYNGDWGKLPSLSVPENLQAGSAEELSHIVELCQKKSYVVEAWRSYQAFWEDISARDGDRSCPSRNHQDSQKSPSLAWQP